MTLAFLKKELLQNSFPEFMKKFRNNCLLELYKSLVGWVTAKKRKAGIRICMKLVGFCMA